MKSTVPVAEARRSAAHFRATLQLAPHERLLAAARARLCSSAAKSEVPCTLVASSKRLFVTDGAQQRVLHEAPLAALGLPAHVPRHAIALLALGDELVLELRARAPDGAPPDALDLPLDAFVLRVQREQRARIEP